MTTALPPVVAAGKPLEIAEVDLAGPCGGLERDGLGRRHP